MPARVHDAAYVKCIVDFAAEGKGGNQAAPTGPQANKAATDQRATPLRWSFLRTQMNTRVA